MQPVHEPAAQKPAHGRHGQGHDAQNQDGQHRGVEQGLGVAEHAQQKAQEQRGDVAHPALQKLRVFADVRLLDGHADEERQNQRRGHRQQQAEHEADDDDEGELRLLRDLRHLHVHVDAPVLFRHHELDQIRIAAVGQAQIQVGDDGDGHEELFGQKQRGEEHHGAVRAADGGHRGRVLGAQAEPGHAHVQGDEGAQLAEDGDCHAAPGLGEQEADLAACADAHEDQAGDEAVGKGEGVDGLQEVDLHDVHELPWIARQGIEDDVADHAARQIEVRGVDHQHADAHGHHDQRLQRALVAQKHQKKTQREQEDACRRDGRAHGEKGADARKEMHQGIHVRPPSRPCAVPAGSESGWSAPPAPSPDRR